MCRVNNNNRRKKKEKKEDTGASHSCLTIMHNMLVPRYGTWYGSWTTMGSLVNCIHVNVF